jgi:hypothetical protein
MRILHTISSVDPAGGGPIESVRQLAVATGMHGHETDIVSLDAPDAPYLSEFPVAVHALGPRFLKYGYSSRFVPWLQENAKHYDVVVVNGPWNESKAASFIPSGDTGSGLWSGSGGVSAYYLQPSWQRGPGVPTSQDEYGDSTEKSIHKRSSVG